MSLYADLELSLQRAEGPAWQVDFRYSQPESDADIRIPQVQPVEALFDLPKLAGLLVDPAEYAAELTRSFFASEALRIAFAQARASARSQNAALRLRLFFGAGAAELHGLCWELLRDPQDNTPLATDANLLFSRYLSSLDWRPVRLKSKGELRALVVVANPSDLGQYKFAALDVDGEISRARAGLNGLPLTVLPDTQRRATLNNLLAALRTAPVDVLYLVCHGYLNDGQPVLVMENEAGLAHMLPGAELVTRFKELEQQPRLVLLVSCQSAGKAGADALSALGPRLAEIGVPAVLGMQDNLSMETAARFLPVFFRELLRDGQIDRAVSVARGTVRERPDAWVPVLTTRLKSGRLWYTPGFGEAGKGFDKFPAILQNIQEGLCTPILGAGLTEPFFGSQRELARGWARQYNYPLRPHEREFLPQVAQYLSTRYTPRFPLKKLEESLRNQIRSRRGEAVPARDTATLTSLIESLGAKMRQSDPNEAHQLLAALPLPVFITTNADTLLEEALTAAHKAPESMLCPWNEYVEQAETIFDRERDYDPTPERPIVYHLFGRWDEPLSLVLTEDNYFKFLIGVTKNRKLIPARVLESLSNAGVLFLGFQTEEWNFRVLFHSIFAQGSNRRNLYTNIAAQIEPEDERILEPAGAKRYLEQYFGGADINIYWGSPGEFLGELLKQWRELPA